MAVRKQDTRSRGTILRMVTALQNLPRKLQKAANHRKRGKMRQDQPAPLSSKMDAMAA
jgi:hypothetical protein